MAVELEQVLTHVGKKLLKYDVLNRFVDLQTLDIKETTFKFHKKKEQEELKPYTVPYYYSTYFVSRADVSRGNYLMSCKECYLKM